MESQTDLGAAAAGRSRSSSVVSGTISHLSAYSASPFAAALRADSRNSNSSSYGVGGSGEENIIINSKDNTAAASFGNLRPFHALTRLRTLYELHLRNEDSSITQRKPNPAMDDILFNSRIGQTAAQQQQANYNLAFPKREKRSKIRSVAEWFIQKTAREKLAAQDALLSSSSLQKQQDENNDARTRSPLTPAASTSHQPQQPRAETPVASSPSNVIQKLRGAEEKKKVCCGHIVGFPALVRVLFEAPRQSGSCTLAGLAIIATVIAEHGELEPAYAAQHLAPGGVESTVMTTTTTAFAKDGEEAATTTKQHHKDDDDADHDANNDDYDANIAQFVDGVEMEHELRSQAESVRRAAAARAERRTTPDDHQQHRSSRRARSGTVAHHQHMSGNRSRKRGLTTAIVFNDNNNNDSSASPSSTAALMLLAASPSSSPTLDENGRTSPSVSTRVATMTPSQVIASVERQERFETAANEESAQRLKRLRQFSKVVVVHDDDDDDDDKKQRNEKGSGDNKNKMQLRQLVGSVDFDRTGFRDPVNHERRKFAKFLDDQNTQQPHFFVSESNEKRYAKLTTDVQRRYLVLCDVFGVKPNTMVLTQFAECATLVDLGQISLRGNYVGDRGLMPLLELARSCHHHVFGQQNNRDVSSSFFGCTCRAAGGGGGRNDDDDDDGCCFCCPTPKLSAMEFASNGITDAGAEHIAEWLMQHVLVMLDQAKNIEQPRPCHRFCQQYQQKSASSNSSNVTTLTIDLSNNPDIGTGGGMALMRALSKIRNACKEEEWWKVRQVDEEQLFVEREPSSTDNNNNNSNQQHLNQNNLLKSSAANLMVSPSTHQLIKTELNAQQPGGGGGTQQHLTAATAASQLNLKKLLATMSMSNFNRTGSAAATLTDADGNDRLLTTYGSTNSLFALDDGGFFSLKPQKSFAPIRNNNAKSTAHSTAAAAASFRRAGTMNVATTSENLLHAPSPTSAASSSSSPVKNENTQQQRRRRQQHGGGGGRVTSLGQRHATTDTLDSVAPSSSFGDAVVGRPVDDVDQIDFVGAVEMVESGSSSGGHDDDDDNNNNNHVEEGDPRFCFIRVVTSGTSIPVGLSRRIVELGLI